MATLVGGRALRSKREAPIRWPIALAGAFATLAILALAQGVGEFLLPILAGGEPFPLTRALERGGAVALFASIVVHNLGLALLLPGCGLLAARAEPHDARRRWIAPILLAALAGAVAVGAVTVIATVPPSDQGFALALAAGEGLAILTVALAAQRELKRFRRRPADAEGLALALRALLPTLLLSGSALAVLAMIEAQHLVA